VSTQPDADAVARRLAETLDRQAEHAGVPRMAPGVPDGGTDPATQVLLERLAAEETWSGPPPELRSRILAAATAQQVSVAQGAAPSAPPSLVRPIIRPRPRWRRLVLAVPIAAVAAAAFTLAVLAVDDYLNRPDQGITYAASGTRLAPNADARISVAPSAAGFAVVLDAHGLPAAAPGSYYAAFLTGPRGLVALGSFHARAVGQPIRMWSGVDPKDYPRFTVTLQREGGPATPSGLVVLTASLTR
jgi:hypothetical protein